MPYSDTTLNSLIINKLTKAQYEQLTPDATQLYFIDDGGINSDISYQQVTLLDNGWSSNSQTVTVTGMKSNAIVWINAAAATKAYFIKANIVCSAQGNNILTFTCTDQDLASYDDILVDVLWAIPAVS